MYVSRQHYYYSGNHAVEITSEGLDYAGSDMLYSENKEYRKLEGAYTDPRDGVKAAIELWELWSHNTEDQIYIAYGSMLDMVEGETEDYPPNLEDIRTWGQKLYDALPKCDKCGDILPDNDREVYSLTDYEELKFCSENCTDSFYWDREKEYYESLTDEEKEEYDERNS